MRSDMRLLHEADLAMAKAVVGICGRYGLRYYMLGGTMLGAIRHKGFIPWDDDMDLGLPRKDYERFLEVAPGELPPMMRVVNYKTDRNYHYYVTRVLDLETRVVETRYEREHGGGETCASIDLFPLDGAPDNLLSRGVFYLKVLSRRAMMSLHYKDGIDSDRKRGLPERLAISLLTKFPTDRMFDAYVQKREIDRILRRYDMSSSKVSGNIMGAYRTREMIPTEWYGEESFYPFEGLELRGLKEYDKYLRHLYGDYMSMPAAGSRKVHFKVVETHGRKVGK